MGSPVFANAMEISSKSMGGKSICEFPDVCFTPPTTPATPPGVPIPYPNTGMAGDTSDGSTSVKIGGEQIMLKDKSAFKQSTGDEAGCAPKKGVISSKIKGKVYFIAWSMDVKVEGENVVRNLDMTTHNHGSPANGSVPMVHVAMVSPGWVPSKCKKEITEEQEACEEFDPYKKGSVCAAAGMTKGVRSLSDQQHLNNATAIQSAPAPADATTKREKALGCLRARRCRLVPYSPKDQKGVKGCCPSQTPDHLLPKASFTEPKANGKGKKKIAGWNGYKSSKAPCMCAEGPSNNGKGSHPLRHAFHKAHPPEGVSPGDPMPFNDAVEHSAGGAATVFKASGCTKACIESQLKAQHKEMAKKGSPPAKVKYTPSGSVKKPAKLKAEISALGSSSD